MSLTDPTVRVGVGVFILRSSSAPSPDDKNGHPSFLLGKRINAHGAGTWATPGGHLEFGETPEKCAAREVLEETGLKVKDMRFLTTTNDFMPDAGRHYVTLFMVCVREDDAQEAKVMEPDKCEGWEWVRWGDLVSWVDLNDADEARHGGERRLFMPLLNLVRQRPEVKPAP